MGEGYVRGVNGFIDIFNRFGMKCGLFYVSLRKVNIVMVVECWCLGVSCI